MPEKEKKELEGEGDINFSKSARNNPQRFGKGTRKYRNQGTSRDQSDYSIVKIDQNTEKSPGFFRRLTVTQTVIPIVIGALGTVTKGLTHGYGNDRMSRDYPNYGIIKIG